MTDPDGWIKNLGSMPGNCEGKRVYVRLRCGRLPRESWPAEATSLDHADELMHNEVSGDAPTAIGRNRRRDENLQLDNCEFADGSRNGVG